MAVKILQHFWSTFPFSVAQPHGTISCEGPLCVDQAEGLLCVDQAEGLLCVDQAEGLLCVDQVPDVLKEPYIFTGYRQLGKPWKYYICSMMILHNEFINVWTHTIGFFVVLLRLVHFLSGFDVLEDKVAWPALGFGMCCLLSLVLSAAGAGVCVREYKGLISALHLLCVTGADASNFSQHFYRWHHFIFFMMDYMGVTFYSFGTGIISMFTCSSKGYHAALLKWFLPANVLLSWFSFYACCLAKTHLSHDNIKRKLLILGAVTLQGIFVSLPVITRYLECILSPTCSLESLNHISLVFFAIGLCGATFAGHRPESWLPGSFDIVGHGHQIFHVLTVVVMLLEFRILDIEINEIGTAQDLHPDLTNICLAFVSLFVLEIATLAYYIHYILFNRLSHEIPRLDVQESLLTKDETEALTTRTEELDVAFKKSTKEESDDPVTTNKEELDVGLKKFN